MKLPAHLTPAEYKTIEQAVRELTTRFPNEVRFIALFGPKARGDFSPHSDIDLLIISESDDWKIRDEIRNPVYDADIEQGTFTSARVIGWERFQNLPLTRPTFFANLRHDAIELWRRPGTENPLQLPEPALAH